MVEVQPFSDHLRADEYVDMALFKIIDQAFEIVLTTRGVEIHPADARFRKNYLEFVLNFLCSIALQHQSRRAACRTDSNHTLARAADMAYHEVARLVVGQRYFALMTFGHPATDIAFEHRRITAPVFKNNGLLSGL